MKRIVLWSLLIATVVVVVGLHAATKQVVDIPTGTNAANFTATDTNMSALFPDNKGELWVGDGTANTGQWLSSTAATDGWVLTKDSAESLNMKWASAGSLSEVNDLETANQDIADDEIAIGISGGGQSLYTLLPTGAVAYDPTTNALSEAYIFKTVDVPTGTDPVATDWQDTLTFTAGTDITITGTGSNTIQIASTASGDPDQNLWLNIDPTTGDTLTADSTTDTLNLAAGTGITITGTSGTDTITIASTVVDTTSVENVFKTHDTPSGTDPVADSATDTLTWAAGTGITITGNETTDTITIASTVVDTDNQSLFETMNTPSGTDPVADSATDTLNWTAGTGITITGDSGTDTITIASTVVDTTSVEDVFKTHATPSGTSPVADSSTDTLTWDAGNNISIIGNSTTDTITIATIDQDLFETMAVPSGTNPVADAADDTLTWAAGTGITITGNETTDTITIASTVVDTDNQNQFETINAPSGTDPVADSATDTLNLVAGADITITGDSATDTITIASTASGDPDQNIWSTMDTPSGTDPTPDSTSDTLTWAAGTGITITGNSTTDTITIASTIVDTDDQNLFETMNTPSGTDPVADSATDTLNWTAGTGISISGDASTDTITITNTSPDTTSVEDVFKTHSTPSGTSPVADSSTDTLTWSAGTGISITGNSTTDTITITNTSPDTTSVEDVFKTINAPSGTDPVADSSTDTLNLVAGTDITITGDSGTDTITIASTATGDPDQNLYDEILTDSGTVVAGQPSDQLGIYGGTGISVSGASGSPDYLTITNTSPNVDQNLFQTIDAPSGTDPVADSTTDTLTLVAGTDITITGDSGTDTITIASTASGDPDQNIWSTMNTPSGTDPTPDSTSDTLNWAAGTGITITGDSGTDTITIASTVTDTDDQNLFETHSTPQGTNPVADSPTDTLTWAQGTGITITGNTTTDTITIASTVVDTTSVEDVFRTHDTPSGTDPVADSAADTLTWAAGTGITITGDSGTDTITIASTVVDTDNQNLFETINAPSGTDPVADSATDTLNLVAGTDITITGDSGTDTITIASTASGDPDQNLFEQVVPSSGDTVVADSTTDSLLMSGTSPITITGTAASDLITIAYTGNQFVTIVPSTGQNVVADSATDTLNLVAGTDITITGDSGTDTITIASTAGGDPDQDLYDEIITDSGTVVAGQPSDVLGVYGGTGISVSGTSGSPDYLTITNTSPNVDQNLWLNVDPTTGDTLTASSTSDTLNLAAGTGITVTGTSGTDTITIASTVVDTDDQNLFETMNTPSGTDPVADSSTDTLNWTAGTGISISGNSTTDTITITNTSPNVDQNLFQTINAPSGTDPVADSTTDTLNLSAGTGITITGDSGTDTITIAATGGSQNLFETMNTPSGTDPVADSATDTLNWTAGTNITITGDSGTDTITVDAVNIWHYIDPEDDTAVEPDTALDTLSITDRSAVNGGYDFVTVTSGTDTIEIGLNWQNNPDRTGAILHYNGSPAVLDWTGDIETSGSIKSANAGAGIYIDTSGDSSAATDEVIIYGVDAIGTGTDELWGEASGSGTKLASHDENGRWVHESFSERSGQQLYIDMQTLMRWVAERYADENDIPVDEVYELRELNPGGYVSPRRRTPPRETLLAARPMPTRGPVTPDKHDPKATHSCPCGKLAVIRLTGKTDKNANGKWQQHREWWCGGCGETQPAPPYIMKSQVDRDMLRWERANLVD